MSMTAAQGVTSPVFIAAPALLDHWQGHRSLTRRVIEAFPDDQLLDVFLDRCDPSKRSLWS